jgi:hypothetical protein
MSSSMGASELSFSLGREAEMILQIKGKADETQEDSLCLFQFFLFCSFYSEAPLLSRRKAKSIDPSLIIKNTH